MYIQRPLAMDNNFEMEAVFSGSQFRSESHPVNLHQRKVVESPALSFYAIGRKTVHPHSNQTCEQRHPIDAHNMPLRKTTMLPWLHPPLRNVNTVCQYM